MVYNMRIAKYDISLITLQNTNTSHRKTLQCSETLQYNTTRNSIGIENKQTLQRYKIT